MGFFPIQSAEHPPFPVIRMPPTEGYVFKTKARAPTLVLFEILRPVVPEIEPLSIGIEPLDLEFASSKEEIVSDNTSPLSTPASVHKPPLHVDSSPTLGSAHSHGGGSSFKLDVEDTDVLVEVESLIGDQIER